MAQPGQLTEAERVRAQEVYAVQCANCHGGSGAGGVMPNGDQVPPLDGNPDVTVPYMDLVMRVGRMPPPQQNPDDNRARNIVIADGDRELLVTYLTEIYDLEGAIPSVDPAAGDATSGQEAYATNCAQCHGSTGAGGIAGAGAWTPPITQAGPIAVAEAVRVGPFEMPAFNAEQITDDEVNALVAYLDYVAQEQGTPVFGLIELNPVYASGFAAAMVVIVVVAVLVIAGRPQWFPDPEGQHRPPERRQPEHRQPDTTERDTGPAEGTSRD